MRLFKRYVITSAGAEDWRLAEVRITTEDQRAEEWLQET